MRSMKRYCKHLHDQVFDIHFSHEMPKDRLPCHVCWMRAASDLDVHHLLLIYKGAFQLQYHILDGFTSDVSLGTSQA